LTKLGSFPAGISFALAILVGATSTIRAQQPKAAARDLKPVPTEKNAAQIELLETKYRFESNGDSRKEVHARVRINNELGARQFARLNFDFNRGFQSVELPLVRVTHASGGTADILPSAIADHPNPAVADYPAYHDVRVKSVRILGLQPDDLLEYRVVTITTHHPLAPDFWLDHTFDRTGVVSEEIFTLDLPGKTNSTTSMDLEHAPDAVYAGVAYSNYSASESNGVARSLYTWTIGPARKLPTRDDDGVPAPDVAVTSFNSWSSVVTRLAAILQNASATDRAPAESALHSIAPEPVSPATAMRAAYDFVSQKIATLDLPPETTVFRRRPVQEILDSRFGTLQEKCFLLALMGELAGVKSEVVLTAPAGEPHHFARPSVLGRPFVLAQLDQNALALDPNLEVAPFAAIPPEFRGKSVLSLAKHHGGEPTDAVWRKLPATSPLEAFQKVNIEAALSADGNLTAKARYIMRGDNELLLRVAFHKTEKNKWKDVAQMLALSDGFRGQIAHVTASDPYATEDPFTVEYEILQPKFVDWLKKTVRIPAILPLPGLPDAPAAAESEAKKPIELGTPLAIDLEAIIQLPAGVTAQAPIGTSVTRDYATFTSKYSVQGNTLHATRSLHFIASELPATRAMDFTAFLHAVQADQTQLFTVQGSAAH
jgi:uncharacterized protein DUF3857